MRTTLALGAMPPPPLLLLLILSPLSVSQEDGDPPSQISAATTTTITSTDQGPRPELTNMPLPSTDASAVSATTTLPQVQGDSSTESRGSVVTTVPPRPEPSVLPSKSDDNPSVGSPTATLGGSQDVKLPTTTIPSTDNRLVPTGDHSIGGGATTAPSATQGGNQPPPSPSSQPTDTVSTSKSPPVLLSASTASPYQSTEATSEAPESSSVGQHSPATIPGTFGPVSSPGFPSTSQGPPSMHTPPAISEEPELTSSQMPAGPTQPFPTAPEPTGSSAETGWTPTIGEATSFSTDLAPTTPKGPSTPSPTSTVGNHKVKCDPAIRPDEKLLILNLTEASLCAGSPPDDKLVSLLCQSVKASFNPARDQCTVQVAPVIESHAVAVKRIIIETKLPPKDVFELLKNKWEELREVGVSDMRLGSEGPPDDMNEDRFSMPLIITIVCMASFLLLVAALYGCCHQRLSQRKDQQRLTEELQTVENGYHDNPTLEVMETSSEMQEKKVVNLNGELGDSWIVPLDNLAKDDLDEEEDTHL